MQVSPALPWEPGVGGVIQLAQGITFEELLANKLKFLYSGDGTGEMDIAEYEGGAVLKISGTTFYGINSWQGRSSTINVAWAGPGIDPSMPYMSEVSVQPSFVSVGITNVSGTNFLTCTDENGDTVFLTDSNYSKGITAQVNGANEITVGFTPTPAPNGPAQAYPPENYNPIEFNGQAFQSFDIKRAMVKKFITDWQEGESSSSYKVKVMARNLVIVPANNLVSGGASPANTTWPAS